MQITSSNVTKTNRGVIKFNTLNINHCIILKTFKINKTRQQNSIIVDTTAIYIINMASRRENHKLEQTREAEHFTARTSIKTQALN